MKYFKGNLFITFPLIFLLSRSLISPPLPLIKCKPKVQIVKAEDYAKHRLSTYFSIANKVVKMFYNGEMQVEKYKSCFIFPLKTPEWILLRPFICDKKQTTLPPPPKNKQTTNQQFLTDASYVELKPQHKNTL